MQFCKSLLITTFFTLLACAFTPNARAEVRAKLQWFDSHGEIMDLDWPTSIQWVWAQDKTPAAQLIITVPNQLNLVTVDASQAKFTNSIPDREGKSTNRTLVVEMEGPRKTIKVKKLDQSEDSKEIGLTIILTTDSPNVIPSDSCNKEGVSIEPRQADANFLFLAASCKMTAQGLRIALQTSNDAVLSRDDEEALAPRTTNEPLVITIPKKTIEAAMPDTLLETIRVEGQARPPMITQFELIYTKDQPEKTAPVRAPKVALPALESAPPPIISPKPWTFTVGLGLKYFAYTQRPGTRGFDPSEYNLSAELTAEHALFSSSTHFKSSLEIPVITFQPNFHFPPSGIYQDSSRVSFTVFDRGKIAFNLEPGIEFDEARFENRPDVSGFYLGPVLGAHLNGTLGIFGNRTMSALFTAAPLTGRNTAPFMQNWHLALQVALEMVKRDPERRWDLLLNIRCLTLHSSSFPDTRATETSLGVRTGF